MDTIRQYLRRTPLIWHIFPTYFIVILGALLAVTLYASRSIQTFYEAQIEADLQVRAHLLADQFLEPMAAGDLDRIDTLCKSLGDAISTRITVILPNGDVAGDTDRGPESMEDHSDRPEIIEALDTGHGSSTRFSNTLKKQMMYAAVPVLRNGDTVGVMRVSVPVNLVRETLITVYNQFILGGAVVALLAVPVSWFVSRRISKPLGQMRRGAERFAQGDFTQQLPVPLSGELSNLAEAMNQMARQLDDRIRTVIRQRNQQEAVLSSMVEGVLAVDTEQRIISFNEAAASLMGLDLLVVQGRPLGDVIDDVPLQRFVANVLETGDPKESEFSGLGENQRILQAHGTALRDAQGKKIGAVVVLNDVTRLRRLERVRRDFVANVSHELRTPITSIKGFVETMLDGALHDPEDARRFLEIVAKQADRLNAILGDLLILSRIEEDERKLGIELEFREVRGVLEAAVQLCQAKADSKEIALDLECGSDVRAPINPSLLEQAVANLVDNAIKYSESGQHVRVRAEATDGNLLIEVSDEGCGIRPEHLPRLFERFYRVDKARSRRMGGTGLGLAIVKHISKAHNGRVSVASQPGSGSTFAIRLPLTMN